MPLVTPRILGQLLRELERDGLVEQVRHGRHPRRVDYELTETGELLVPLLQWLAAFGRGYGTRHRIEILADSEGEGTWAGALRSSEPARSSRGRQGRTERAGSWSAWSWLLPHPG